MKNAIVGLFFFCIASSALSQSHGEAVSHGSKYPLEQFRGCRNVANAEVIDGTTIKSASDLGRYNGRPVIIANAKLAGVDFSGVRLSNICFDNSDLRRTNWQGAKTSEIDFIYTDFGWANAAGADFFKARFLYSSLTHANFAKASLVQAQKLGGPDEGLNLQNANLTRFKYECESVQGPGICDHYITSFEQASAEFAPVDARGANLTKARFSGYFGDWKLADAQLDGTWLELRDLPNLRKAKVKGSIFVLGSANAKQPALKLSASETQQVLDAFINDELAVDGVDTASFDCAKASTKAEKLICERDGTTYASLAERDNRLARVWRDTVSAGLANVGEQRAWLKRRDACTDGPKEGWINCINDQYHSRMQQLLDRMPPYWDITGQPDALFLDSDLPVNDAFRKTALYEKLKPTLIAASNYIYVRKMPDGRIWLSGEGVGGNGHMCSISGAVVYDAELKGYGRFKSYDGTIAASVRLRGQTIDALSNSDISSCGARAGWIPDMRRLSVSSKIMAPYRESFRAAKMLP